MSNVVPFVRRPIPRRSYDRERARTHRPAVRVALDFGYWCVERVAGYVVTSRVRMPTRVLARREAQRIAEDEGIDLLATRFPPGVRDSPEDLCGPDDEPPRSGGHAA